MQYLLRLSPCLVLAASCGGEAERDFSRPVSEAIFDTANGELHTLHLAGLELDEWPTTYQWECPEGGLIEMVTIYNGDPVVENIDKLEHTLLDCVLDGRTISGTMDYTDFRFVPCGSADGVSFDIEADLEISGPEEGSCTMDAREDCGRASGSTCGYNI